MTQLQISWVYFRVGQFFYKPISYSDSSLWKLSESLSISFYLLLIVLKINLFKNINYFTLSILYFSWIPKSDENFDLRIRFIIKITNLDAQSEIWIFHRIQITTGVFFLIWRNDNYSQKIKVEYSFIRNKNKKVVGES